jgi:hypothetical protein
MLRPSAARAGLLVTALSGSALATVTEPNGLVVPVASGGGETQLSQMFATRGEPIDWQLDAVAVPETFSPLCDFSAEFLLREAGGQFPLGWYNADPSAAVGPPASQIYEVVACNTAPGAVITSQTIRNHPSYAGGLVGFALANGSGCVSFGSGVNQIHYSEKRFNPTYLNNPASPWITNLVYDSKLEPNAFYLAFEDGNVDWFSFNNDGDFNDFVVLLRGLVCPGGGGPCDTGLEGVCGPGVEQCRNGQLECEGLFPPGGTETCNGLDDDCDGAIDDGDLCPADEICDNGVCVGKCGTSEFQCPPNEVCNDAGYCVDPSCVDVDCPADQICVAGQCKAPCDGVVCPHGQQCRLGHCVDPCATVSCDTSEVCVDGVCRASCVCAPCAAGFECSTLGDGLCVEAGCGSVSCPAGQFCQAGTCVDSCAGAVCPPGQTCETGDCVDDPNADAGPPGDGGGGTGPFVDGGFSGTAAVGTGGSAAGTAGAAGSGAAGAAGGAQGSGGSFPGPAESESGCGCRAATLARGGAVGVVAAALVMLVRRRRSRARSL